MALETIEIADLRLKTTASVMDTYSTTDKYCKGVWYYDNLDITSLDDGVTIIVSNSISPQLTFKRILKVLKKLQLLD